MPPHAEHLSHTRCSDELMLVPLTIIEQQREQIKAFLARIAPVVAESRPPESSRTAERVML